MIVTVALKRGIITLVMQDVGRSVDHLYNSKLKIYRSKEIEFNLTLMQFGRKMS